MIFYYLDASVWVKRYYQEPGTTWINNLFTREPVVACASLGFVEVAATLARKHKAREIEAALYQQTLDILSEEWGYFVQVQLSEEVVGQARDLAVQLALRGADAVHLASAVVMQKHLDRNDQLIFVTSDKELGEAASVLEMQTTDPVDEEDGIAQPTE